MSRDPRIDQAIEEGKVQLQYLIQEFKIALSLWSQNDLFNDIARATKDGKNELHIMPKFFRLKFLNLPTDEFNKNFGYLAECINKIIGLQANVVYLDHMTYIREPLYVLVRWE